MGGDEATILLMPAGSKICDVQRIKSTVQSQQLSVRGQYVGHEAKRRTLDISLLESGDAEGGRGSGPEGGGDMGGTLLLM